MSWLGRGLRLGAPQHRAGWKALPFCSQLVSQPCPLRLVEAHRCWRALTSASAPVDAAPAETAKGGRKSASSIKSDGPQQQQQQQPINLSSLPGTKDFLPEDMRLRNWLFGLWARISEQYGFEMVEGPVLESEELYIRKAGEEIVDQLYNFEDKGNRRVTLRPELTPSLARLALQKGKALTLPAKWSQIGQCWRYERATRGRRRVHWQWNLDIIGIPGVEAEAEMLAAMVSFFKTAGLGPQDVGIKISSRKVLQQVLQQAGVPDSAFGPVCVIVDKLDKIGQEKVTAELQGLGISSEAISTIFDVVKLSNVEDLNAILGEESETARELQQLFRLLEGYGCGDWLVFDASIIRGLAYYTGVVFEAFDRRGELRAIAGGGRYDNLLATFGGEGQPCAGFGFGDAVIVELLSDRGLLPSLPHQVDDLLVVMDESLRPEACGIANRLREAGRTVDFVLQPRKMKWIFKHTERCGAGRLIIVGKDEWEKGAVRVKNLAERTEGDVLLSELLQPTAPMSGALQ